MEHLNLGDGDDEIEFLEEELAWDGGVFNPSLCLIGRFLTNKHVRHHVVKQHMREGICE